jgi:hypothetical protein
MLLHFLVFPNCRISSGADVNKNYRVAGRPGVVQTTTSVLAHRTAASWPAQRHRHA